MDAEAAGAADERQPLLKDTDGGQVVASSSQPQPHPPMTT